MAPIQCCYCETVTSSLSKYKNHLRARHYGKKPFLCDTCGLSYGTKPALEEHTEVEHVLEGTSAHVCIYCPQNKSFKYKSDLNKHIRDKHTIMDIKQQECAIKLNPNEADEHLILTGHRTDLHGKRRSTRKPKQELHFNLYMKLCSGSLEKEYFEKVQFGKPRGFGIVARKTFPKGTHIIEYDGDLIERSEANIRDEQYADFHAYRFDFSAEGRAMTLDATFDNGRYGRLLNHSKLMPNLQPVIMPNFLGQDRVLFRTIHEISKGQELLWDYKENRPEVLKANPWLTNS